MVMTPIPALFTKTLAEQFGPEEGNALAASLDTPPSVSVRVNSRKNVSGSDTAALLGSLTELETISWARGGYTLKERPSFTLDPLLHAGAYYVQDAASMYVSALVEEIVSKSGGKPLRVLDLCAAPGGKSIAAMEALPEGSVVVSNEVVPARAAVLRENMMKWGWPAGVVASATADKWGRMQGHFDLMIIDAPCSGEGMMRKEEVARTQWSPALVEQCAALQRQIVEEALPALRPGGWLIYSTCTFNRHEDEENVEWFCKTLGLEPVGEARRFTPLHDGTEGLFIAVLRRKGEGQEKNPGGDRPRERKGGKGKKEKATLTPEMIRQVSSWLKRSGDWSFAEEKGKVTAYPEELRSTLEALPSDIRILSKGIEVAEIKGRDLVPSHPLALSTAFRPGAFPEAELDKDTALGYLRRETPPLSTASAAENSQPLPKGYVVAKYLGRPLGFLKNLGSRYNNLYPKEWRILKR